MHEMNLFNRINTKNAEIVSRNAEELKKIKKRGRKNQRLNILQEENSEKLSSK